MSERIDAADFRLADLQNWIAGTAEKYPENINNYNELMEMLTVLAVQPPSFVQGTDVAQEAEPEMRAAEISSPELDPIAMTKRILTIDDSKTMRDMLMLTLAGAGFDVLQAVDGADGLEVLARERVDLIITDINMPNMDGYEVIRRVRANPAHRALPILVLTTEGEADKRAIAREAGATGWMVKPFDPDRLLETVAKVAA